MERRVEHFEGAMSLPFCYRFLPTAEDLIYYCLLPKVTGNLSVLPNFIFDIDLYEKEPWKIFDKEVDERFYVFTKLRMIKSRVQRTAGLGYWKGQRTYEIKDCKGRIVGCDRQLTFQVKNDLRSKSEKDADGHWIMHEYSLPEKKVFSAEGQIVLCSIRNTKAKGKSNLVLEPCNTIEDILPPVEKVQEDFQPLLSSNTDDDFLKYLENILEL